MGTNQVIDITAWATAVQAVSAVIMLFVTVWVGYLTKKQSNNAKLQTQYMKMQANLSLHQKRYDIYTSLMEFINTVLEIPIPQQGENTILFNNQYQACLGLFWKKSRERFFLFDNNLNLYIDSVTKKTGDYFTVVISESPPVGDREYGQWLINIDNKRTNLLPLIDEGTYKFKECMSYRILEV